MWYEILQLILLFICCAVVGNVLILTSLYVGIFCKNAIKKYKEKLKDKKV